MGHRSAPFPLQLGNVNSTQGEKPMEDIENGQASGAGAMTFAIWALIWAAALVLLLRP
jgi:hypothetical protein